MGLGLGLDVLMLTVDELIDGGCVPPAHTPG